MKWGRQHMSNMNQASFAPAGGITTLSLDEIDFVYGGSTVTTVAAHVAAVSSIVAGVAALSGAEPVAVAAGVVAGLAGAVAAFA